MSIPKLAPGRVVVVVVVVFDRIVLDSAFPHTLCCFPRALGLFSVCFCVLGLYSVL